MIIGTELCLDARSMQTVRRAALLHDIGKLSVPNSILDKPGKLTGAEFELVKAHPRLSRDILNKVVAFRDIARLAGDHHEKLDGSGYPNHLNHAALPLEARLIAVADVYSALSEERPYRQALQSCEVFSIMDKDVPHKLDGTCYEALRFAVEARERKHLSPPFSAIPPEQIPVTALLANGSRTALEQEHG